MKNVVFDRKYTITFIIFSVFYITIFGFVLDGLAALKCYSSILVFCCLQHIVRYIFLKLKASSIFQSFFITTLIAVIAITFS